MAKRKTGAAVWTVMRSTAAMTAGLAVAQIAAAATAFHTPDEAGPAQPANQRLTADALSGLYCGTEVGAARAEAAAARLAAQDAEAAASLGRAAAARAEGGDGLLMEGSFSAFAGDDVFASAGHGLVAWDDGRVYAGAYDSLGGRNGPGVCAKPAGWRYAGMWVDGAAMGPGVSAHDGVQDFAGVRDRAGVIVFPDGSVYAGGVRGGHEHLAVRDGPGVQWDAKGAVVHDGMWRADQPA
jgi:hypothetical protein